ncbi:MAG: hypothetical protein Q7S21_01830 [archaeon]|nr:hypothetical protein [archaeon]
MKKRIGMKKTKILIAIFLILFIIASGCIATQNNNNSNNTDLNDGIIVANNSDNNQAQQVEPKKELTKGELLKEKVAPTKGLVLPVKWKNSIALAVEAGAIDVEKYKQSLAQYNEQFTPEEESIINGSSDENIVFSPETALFNLRMLWALGLVNDNNILTAGKISEYEEPGRFASTGGWTLGTKTGGELLASKKIIKLTQAQQEIVKEVAENSYRPCCNNSTAFPDCNHGMAALALAELMASQNASKEQIYNALLVANSYWFTQNYVNIAAYFEEQGKKFEDIDAKEILGKDYSSSTGNITITHSLESIPQIAPNGGSC